MNGIVVVIFALVVIEFFVFAANMTNKDFLSTTLRSEHPSLPDAADPDVDPYEHGKSAAEGRPDVEPR